MSPPNTRRATCPARSFRGPSALRGLRLLGHLLRPLLAEGPLEDLAAPRPLVTLAHRSESSRSKETGVVSPGEIVAAPPSVSPMIHNGGPLRPPFFQVRVKSGVGSALSKPDGERFRVAGDDARSFRRNWM